MTVNIGYAYAQWVREQQTAAEHPDAEVRGRAAAAAAKWEGVIAGMQAGTIDVGSRTPTSAPAWVTLEVATGGFATGGHSAGGPLLAHEHALAERLGIVASRVALNLHYRRAGDADALLASGCYRIDVPEEGALLVVAWLRRRGELARANELVEVLAPWFATLRFYPVPAEHPIEATDTVRLQDVSATLRGLDTGRRQPRFETMREAVRVWRPLCARAIALFAETIDGPLPVREGRQVTGGRPGKVFPAGWHARVEALAAELERAGEAKTERAREAASLVQQLCRCAKDPASLSVHEYDEVQRAIARAHATQGTAERQAADEQAVAGTLHVDLRRVLVERLRSLPAGAGVEPAALAAVTPDEAARFGVPAGSALPGYFEAKVARSYDAPLETLVARGVIASGEVLARVLPQVTSQVRACTIDDAAARRLYAALYTAFRRRRGLLLVGYQHQVQLAELPWVAALDRAHVTTEAATTRARVAVASTSRIALRAFPYTITPNKLVTELSALTGAAALKLPLVEELAADIFMGAFTAKFVEAAQVSARLLAGTLYQRYFAIDGDELARLPTTDKISKAFAAICARRAGGGEARSFVARNGKIIEQAQILTTHNLGVLFAALPLREQLAGDLRTIAERCYQWAVRRLRLPTRSWHHFLVNLKNAAYAWRQMVFYLSFDADTAAFLGWARKQLEPADEAFRLRFEPAIRGLELAAAGIPASDVQFGLAGGRVLTGWSTERHWLAPSPA